MAKAMNEAETALYEALAIEGIPFEFRKRLRTDDGTRIVDFYIQCTEDRSLVILIEPEHPLMLDDYRKRKKIIKRLRNVHKISYLERVNYHHVLKKTADFIEKIKGFVRSAPSYSPLVPATRLRVFKPKTILRKPIAPCTRGDMVEIINENCKNPEISFPETRN